MNKTKLMLGDNIQSLKKLPENSIDSVVTDPPYGLSAPKNSGKTSKGGFMNKKWDYDVPSVEFWKEVYRVLKPGGHVLSFGGTRTYHRMVVNMEDAGFEIRDQIMWLYGSGFPKSLNVGKAVDKLEGNEREVVGDNPNRRDSKSSIVNIQTDKCIIDKGTSPFEGWGTALKPANEPICLARKPLSEKSVAENVLKWKTGGINVDGCRVATDDNLSRLNKKNPFSTDMFNKPEDKFIDSISGSVEGRFPANIILECICDEVIKGEKGEIKKSSGSRDGLDITHEWGYGKINRTTFTDKGDIHTNPMCPCRLMDEQSGDSKSIKSKRGGAVDSNSKTYNWNNGDEKIIDKYECGYNDKGGASRFFYQAKVSKQERNMGLDGFEEKETKGSIGLRTIGGTPLYEKGNSEMINNRIMKNNHPTVKPVNLMTYLCRLITPEGGIVLDPFMGSGSTGISAQLEGFRFVGMEMDPDYFKIAEARINSFEEYRKFLK